jgi:hypothetical protein
MTMFDPTIFDNLKVAFENQLYDLDNLTGQIQITHRNDRMEMSVMSREFSIQFQLYNRQKITAEIRLEASLKDLAAEILELSGEAPACALRLFFYMPIENVSTQCEQIEDIIHDIWQPELPPIQHLSFVYDQEPVIYMNKIELRFHRKINEEQMGDIPTIISHTLRTLTDLHKMESRGHK